MLLLLNKNQQ